MPFIVIVYARDAARARQIRDQHRGATVGIYNYPAKDERFCPGGGCGGRVSGWGRHRTNGHLIHTCGGRNRRWRQMMRGMLYDVFGRNQLANPPAQFRNPDGV